MAIDLSPSAKRTFSQIFRYGVVGLLTNLVGYALYLLLTTYVLGPKPTMTILYLASAFLGYFSHKRVTFSHQGQWTLSGIRYVCAHLVGYMCNFLILYIFHDRLALPHQWVQLASIPVVAGVLFLLFKFYVFPGREARGV